MRPELLESIQHWHDLAVLEEERGIYNQQVVGHGGANFARAETHRGRVDPGSRRRAVALLVSLQDTG